MRTEKKIKEKSGKGKEKKKKKGDQMIPRLAFFLLGLLAQETSCSKR